MVTDTASLEDNREWVDKTRHDDIVAVWNALYLVSIDELDDDTTDDEIIVILETACKKALKDIEKIKETKY